MATAGQRITSAQWTYSPGKVFQYNESQKKYINVSILSLNFPFGSFLYILTYSQVGIGALVIHPTTGKMLAVQERTGPAAKRKVRVVVLFLPYY